MAAMSSQISDGYGVGNSIPPPLPDSVWRARARAARWAIAMRGGDVGMRWLADKCAPEGHRSAPPQYPPSRVAETRPQKAPCWGACCCAKSARADFAQALQARLHPPPACG